MKTKNPLRDKSYAFAVQAVNLCFKLQKKKKEYIISKQFLRSATSIGANIEEAIGGQSEKDFLHKISISYKEARESRYWLRLMADTTLIDNETKDSFLMKVNELLKIMGSIQITMKSKKRD